VLESVVLVVWKWIPSRPVGMVATAVFENVFSDVFGQTLGFNGISVVGLVAVAIGIIVTVIAVFIVLVAVLVAVIVLVIVIALAVATCGSGVYGCRRLLRSGRGRPSVHSARRPVAFEIGFSGWTPRRRTGVEARSGKGRIHRA